MSFRPALHLRLGLILVILLLVLGAAWRFLSERSEARKPALAAEASTPGRLKLTPAQWASLNIAPVRSVDFDSVIVADGVVATDDNTTAAVFSQFSGRVTAVPVQLGQTVSKGAPLATVLASEMAQSNSDLVAAQAAEDTAAKQLQLARQTEHRQHELFKAEVGAQKDWLQSQADLNTAENALHAAQAARSAAQDRARILGAGQGASGTIRAPIAGVVMQRQVAPGQFVSSLASGGGGALFSIADLHRVWVMANVSEDQAAFLTLGQQVEISALALPGRTFKARLNWIAAAVDPTTHRVAARAELPNPDLALKPQMALTVRLLAGHPLRSVAVARSAVIYDGDEARCYVVTAERTLASRKLEIGRTQDDMVEVRSGLQPTDRVVTRGALFIDRAAEAS